MWERLGSDLPKTPAAEEVPAGTPSIAYPRGEAGEVRVTFVGHATLLVQTAGANILTDPTWSRRAGWFSLLWGPRFTEPGIDIAALPPLDAVLLSHGHYDHLDARTVRKLVALQGGEVPWVTPLGYGPWLRRRGVSRVMELDWWEETTLDRGRVPIRILCLPARHTTLRGLRVDRQLWSSWALLPERSGTSIYFGGDSGYGPAFRDIGHRVGPFRAAILPIGGYEPRWFTAEVHMTPEEAVRAYQDLGAEGAFIGMHWGAFRLTDEDPLEPPERTRRAWFQGGLPPEALHLPGIGGTVPLPAAEWR